MKILIVDDDQDILEYYKEILDDGFPGVEVDTASNGALALHLCSGKLFDLICTDFQMPVMTGLDFTNHLRRGDGLNQKSAVIFLSGFIDQFQEEVDVIENVFFLPKPVRADRLLRVASVATGIPLKS